MCRDCLAVIPGSIPAWAGETQRLGGSHSPLEVYPRVGGGNGLADGEVGIGQGLSPRGRGKRLGVEIQLLGQGSIPAWAGETELPL